ncbi:hypothetical protein OsI_14931 [Oryza sativa Indica Group]|uniref:F-box domain-containing protein n=1 Tax=Oryza sativa subsp. indica TaxID=39946 RepID=A2XQL5_ORYSI|nr:hypothetical protein OsI_14931 [Oryza sativa Indica Group]
MGISDWSSLPKDIVIVVMGKLEIPDLLSAGAVCASWRAACTAVRRVRFPITDKSPCLLYSCEADDPDLATFYSPSNNATFKVRLPGPPFRRRYTVGSDHGWIVTADELSNLQVINPLSGVQIDLPPVTELYNVESFIDEQGSLMYNNYEDSMHRDDPLGFPVPYPSQRLRLFLYFRVILSCSPSAGSECVVLLLHSPDGQLSFARIGDHSWTRLTDIENLWDRGYRHAVYNKNDGLFYLLHFQGSIHTLNLNGPSPVVNEILKGVTAWDNPTKSIVMTPRGDMLQVWRCRELRWNDAPVQFPSEDSEDVHDPCQELYTDEMLLYKVDFDGQKLDKMDSLEDHVLFLGFNSSICLSAKDFPNLRPGCAYLADDSYEEIGINKHTLREVGIWNFKSETLESLGDPQSVLPWLNWPPPIWITPSIL